MNVLTEKLNFDIPSWNLGVKVWIRRAVSNPRRHRHDNMSNTGSNINAFYSRRDEQYCTYACRIVDDAGNFTLTVLYEFKV